MFFPWRQVVRLGIVLHCTGEVFVCLHLKMLHATGVFIGEILPGLLLKRFLGKKLVWI